MSKAPKRALTEDGLYYKNAGIVVMNEDGHIWVGERSDIKGSWQLPQGGMDDGEDILEAARRELEEETSISRSDVELLAIHPEWLTYDFPTAAKKKGPVKGQSQKWFLFRYKGNEKSIDLKKAKDNEFSNWKWETPETVEKEVVDFRKEIYADVLKTFAPHLNNPTPEEDA